MGTLNPWAARDLGAPPGMSACSRSCRVEARKQSATCVRSVPCWPGCLTAGTRHRDCMPSATRPRWRSGSSSALPAPPWTAAGNERTVRCWPRLLPELFRLNDAQVGYEPGNGSVNPGHASWPGHESHSGSAGLCSLASPAPWPSRASADLAPGQSRV